MTIREVINALLDYEMDKELVVEVNVNEVTEKAKGYTWCALTINEITNCYDIAIVSAKELY